MKPLKAESENFSYIKRQDLKACKENPNTLTPEEIKQLFEATYTDDGSPSDWNEEAGIRDRALLSLCYGCSLRQDEIQYLNIDDVNLEKGFIHVKKGKDNKERFVPISKNTIKYLEEYTYNIRPSLLKIRYTEAFLISISKNRMSDQVMNLRLKVLVQRTNNPKLIEKNPSFHTLCHSIVSHLLGNGMKLEQIAKFLGYSSFESMPIATHLVEEENMTLTANKQG